MVCWRLRAPGRAGPGRAAWGVDGVGQKPPCLQVAMAGKPQAAEVADGWGREGWDLVGRRWRDAWWLCDLERCRGSSKEGNS